jgi:hypothetical protein
MDKGRAVNQGLIAGAVLLLGACTAPIPADVELVSVEAVARGASAPPAGVLPAGLTADEKRRPLRVAFASRVNLVRFVTTNSYSLNVEARFCDSDEATADFVASGIYWQGVLLVPGGPDPIQAAKQSRDDLVDYSFFLDPGNAAADTGDICFNIAGGNEDRGYRSNTVVIPQIEIALVLQQ